MKLEFEIKPKDMIAAAFVIVIIYLLQTGNVNQAIELIQSVLCKAINHTGVKNADI